MTEQQEHAVAPLDGAPDGTWRCSCGRVFTSAHGFVSCPDRPPRPLPLIGREASLIRGLAKQIHREGVRGHAITPLSDYGENGRGWHFEVHLKEPGPAGQDTGRVARVAVTLDRVYRYCATHGRQHDDDGDPTCRWE
jgi:hypothetical protein